MLWLKNWLETRWRVGVALIWGGVFIWLGTSGFPMLGNTAIDPLQRLPALLGVVAYLWVFVPVLLAGNGIVTASARPLGSSKGLYGSTLLTLSLPVTRRQLLSARGGVGVLETALVTAILQIGIWALFPDLLAVTTFADALGHYLTALVCALAFYAFATFTASFLDEGWNTRGTMVVVTVLWVLSLRGQLPAPVNVFSTLVDASPLITHALPWSVISVAFGLALVFFFAALRVVQRREY